MADLHGSYAGINKAMDLARTCVYWPGMEADVTDYIKWCLMCIKCSNLPVKTLQPHKVPPGPWVKIGVDFFQDHHSGLYGKSSQIDSFQDHYLYKHIWLLSRPFGMYTVKLASEIVSFQDHCVYTQNWLLSRPYETYTVENNIKLTPFKTITFELYSVWTSMEEPSIDSSENTVYFGLLSRPSED